MVLIYKGGKKMKKSKPQKKLSQKELKKRRLNYFLSCWLNDIEKKTKRGFLK